MIDIQFPLDSTLNLIFRDTDIAIQVAGLPPTPYHITLMGLLVILVLSIAAMAITERLTHTKPGGIAFGIIVTIIGAALAATFLLIPFDFEIEGVRVLAALIGAIVVATFFTLLKGAASNGGGGHGGGGGGHGGSGH